MKKKESNKTLYDKVLIRIKNNPFFVFLIFLFIFYISLSQAIYYFFDHRENISDLIDAERPSDTVTIENKPKMEIEKKLHDKSKSDGNIKVQEYSFFLVLNSSQINSKIYLDDLPARIKKGKGTLLPEIKVKNLDVCYTIKILGEKITCEKEVCINEPNEFIYACN